MTQSTAAIVATFNQESYIAEAVLSIAVQVDEVIVVDDASSDGTAHVLASLELPNLTILRNEKQRGVSVACNRAVAATSADILILHGGDDRSVPGRVAAQLVPLADEHVALVHSSPIVIDALGRRLPAELAAEFLVLPSAADPLAFLFFESNFICAPSVAIRRTDYERFGGFKQGIDLLQDYGLWLHLATAGDFVQLDEPVVEYRKHGRNVSREYTGLDGPQRRRLAAERAFLLGDFLESTDRGTLTALAQALGITKSTVETLENDELICVIELNHRDRLVIRQGLSRMFAIAAQEDGEGRLARLGLTIADLNTFALRADHENLSELATALSVRTQLTTSTADTRDIPGTTGRIGYGKFQET